MRHLTWKSFLEAHWDALASMDFATIEVWTRRVLVTYCLLFFMELATRRVHFARQAANPDEGWMLQEARDLTDAEEGFRRGKKYLLGDRDAKFPEAFRIRLRQGGVEAVRLPACSPNLNPNLEGFMRSVEEECLGRTIFIGERALQSAAICFLEHYDAEPNHQEIGDLLIASPTIEEMGG